jgi:hypothetical protein
MARQSIFYENRMMMALGYENQMRPAKKLNAGISSQIYDCFKQILSNKKE